jgi:hypothetical protein
LQFTRVNSDPDETDGLLGVIDKVGLTNRCRQRTFPLPRPTGGKRTIPFPLPKGGQQTIHLPKPTD